MSPPIPDFKNGEAYNLPAEDVVKACYARGIFFNYKPHSDGVVVAVCDNYESHVKHLAKGTECSLWLNCPLGPYDNDRNVAVITASLIARGCTVAVEQVQPHLYRLRVTV